MKRRKDSELKLQRQPEWTATMYHSVVLGQSSRRSLGLDWPLYFISLHNWSGL
jgi:hypothetical protein